MKGGGKERESDVEEEKMGNVEVKERGDNDVEEEKMGNVEVKENRNRRKL